MEIEKKEGLENGQDTRGTGTGTDSIRSSVNTGASKPGTSKGSKPGNGNPSPGKPQNDNNGVNPDSDGVTAGNSEPSGNSRNDNTGVRPGNGGTTGTGDGGNTGASPGSTTSTEGERVSQKSTVLKPKEVKPSKSKAKVEKTGKKTSDDITDPETLSVIIQSASGLLSGLIRRPHWLFSEEEALTIASPAATMLQKLTSSQKKKISQLSAPILLGSAIASVVLPKVLIDLTMARRDKVHAGNKYQSATIPQTTVSEPNGITGISSPDAAHTDIPQTLHKSDNEELAQVFRGLDDAARPAEIKV